MGHISGCPDPPHPCPPCWPMTPAAMRGGGDPGSAAAGSRGTPDRIWGGGKGREQRPLRTLRCGAGNARSCPYLLAPQDSRSPSPTALAASFPPANPRTWKEQPRPEPHPAAVMGSLGSYLLLGRARTHPWGQANLGPSATQTLPRHPSAPLPGCALGAKPRCPAPVPVGLERVASPSRLARVLSARARCPAWVGPGPHRQCPLPGGALHPPRLAGLRRARSWAQWVACEVR